MSRIVTPEELKLSACVAQYINQGAPSQTEREARAERLVKFLTKQGEYIPSKYVLWWLVVAFLLGTQWRLVLAVFHP